MHVFTHRGLEVRGGEEEVARAVRVVGGAVRDLLIGVHPKDFDVATNASPEEVHRLFRRSRLIGRRFKIAHVIFGDETVEVSTFRSGDAADTDEDCDGGADDADTSTDPATRSTFYADADGDTYGDAAVALRSCAMPAGRAGLGAHAVRTGAARVSTSRPARCGPCRSGRRGTGAE